MIERTELIRQLREVQGFKPGDPMPEWAQPITWGEFLSKLCGQAADELTRTSAHCEGK